MKTIIIGATLSALSVSSNAAITYQYTGPAFDDFFHPANDDSNILGLTRLSGWIILADPLPTGQNTANPIVIDYEFTDGRSTLNDANSNFSETLRFTTDAAGSIESWKIFLETNNQADLTIKQMITSFNPALNENGRHDQSSYCYSSFCTIRTGGDVAPNDFGSWTAVPTPAAAWLFGSALLGLIKFRGRR